MSEHSAKRTSLPSVETEHSAKTSFAEGRIVVECSSLGTRQRQPLPSARDKKNSAKSLALGKACDSGSVEQSLQIDATQ